MYKAVCRKFIKINKYYCDLYYYLQSYRKAWVFVVTDGYRWRGGAALVVQATTRDEAAVHEYGQDIPLDHHWNDDRLYVPHWNVPVVLHGIGPVDGPVAAVRVQRTNDRGVRPHKCGSYSG